MYRVLALSLTSLYLLTGCGAQPSAPPAEAPAQEATDTQEDAPPMRNFAEVTIGPYTVQPMFEEEIEDGHYNIEVQGAQFAAVRAWVGNEAAEGVMVVKGMEENDYQHFHVEVPDPIAEDTRLWIEIEAADGTLHKGSVELVEAG